MWALVALVEHLRVQQVAVTWQVSRLQEYDILKTWKKVVLVVEQAHARMGVRVLHRLIHHLQNSSHCPP
jgi:hypothetical protein